MLKYVNDIKKAPKALQRLLALLFASILFICFLLVGWLMPFEPLKFNGYIVTPNTTCAGDDIEVLLRSRVDSGPYTIQSIDGYGYWIDETGKPFDSMWISKPLSPHPDAIVESIVSRVGPSREGVAYPGGKFTVHGRMFGVVPTTQDITVKGEDAVFVLDNTKCEE